MKKKMDTTHYKQDTPKMHDRTALRVRLIHASIVPSFSPSRKPLGPFGSLEAEREGVSLLIRPHDDGCAPQS